MKSFTDKIAVVTGGGSGIGRELVRQLAAEGASVAMCDLHMAGMIETRDLCLADGVRLGVRFGLFAADVAKEDQLLRFRDEMARLFETEVVHLLINNAGIGGGGSIFADSRENWDRTFGVCWSGVYYTTRAFLPMLVRADQGHIVNVSSLCGFWASRGPDTPNTAYSAAKFAVKGFTEALITDLKVNAPHIHCSVAMPGRIGTDIAANSRMVLSGRSSPGMTDVEVGRKRARLQEQQPSAAELSDAEIRAMVARTAAQARERAPMGPDEAARIILNGVRDQRWRILVGRDAEELDVRVRSHPEAAYDDDFQGPFG